MTPPNDSSVIPGTWKRDTFNGRSSYVAPLIDLRWYISRVAHFTRFTLYHELSGPLTPFELLFALLLAVISPILAISSSATVSGAVTMYLIFLGVLVSLKKNIMQLFFGVSWERAILFHKIFGTVALVTACIHGIPRIIGKSTTEISADGKLSSGLPMLIIIAFQPVLYWLIKPKYFELFYYLHLVGFLIMVYFAVMHGASFVLFAAIALGCDLLLRYVLTPRRVMISASCQPGSVVEISFDKKPASAAAAAGGGGAGAGGSGSLFRTQEWVYRGGQYVFIMIPALGHLEWHPLSMSSAPHEGRVTLHASNLGGWTGHLADMCAADSAGFSSPAFIEGPYGLPSVNLEDDTYKIVLLISGSIGVTPNQSIANSLLHAHAQGRPLKKIVYVWTLREAKVGLVNTMIAGNQLPISDAKELRELRKTGAIGGGSVVVGGGGLAGKGTAADAAENGLSRSLVNGGKGAVAMAAAVEKKKKQGQEESHSMLEMQTPSSVTAVGAAAGGGFSSATALVSGVESVDMCDIPTEGIVHREIYCTGTRASISAAGSSNVNEASGHGHVPASEAFSFSGFSSSASSAKQRLPSHMDGGIDGNKSSTSGSGGRVGGRGLGGASGGQQLHGVPVSEIKHPLLFGRPDFPDLFARTRRLALALGEQRVAVCVCGPAGMIEAAVTACRNATSAEVVFDLHVEVFRL
jgi:predicted ferric reductase